MIAAGLVIVILLVTFDLDRPTRGLIRVPVSPLVQARAAMVPPPAASLPSHQVVITIEKWVGAWRTTTRVRPKDVRRRGGSPTPTRGQQWDRLIDRFGDKGPRFERWVAEQMGSCVATTTTPSRERSLTGALCCSAYLPLPDRSIQARNSPGGGSLAWILTVIEAGDATGPIRRVPTGGHGNNRKCVEGGARGVSGILAAARYP